MGEVYSKQSDLHLDRLQIRLRRVRANIDNPKRFIETAAPGYVPVRAAFEAADADLLKLLIEPLYGDRPEVGVRELVQNAVDAVLELREYCHREQIETSSVHLRTITNDASVDVSIHPQVHEQRDSGVPSHWEQWIEITDTGIGMDDAIIRNYFLKAGASFRRSDAWHRLFDLPELDESVVLMHPRKARIFRSGRFGIGVLAAFLLGPEIQVITRRIGQARGITFLATIDSENIELRFVDCPIGTVIRIRTVGPSRLDVEDRYPSNPSKWDWFCLEQPRIIRRGPSGSLIPQRFALPQPKSALPTGFRRIAVAEYDDLQWTYTSAPRLACNGLIVDGTVFDGFSRNHEWTIRGVENDLVCGLFRFKVPNISVFDSGGSLPLNLQRTRLTVDRYPFEADLLADVLRDFFAFTFVNAPEQPLVSGTVTPRYYSYGYPSLSFQDSHGISFLPLLSTPEGISIADAWYLFARKVHSVLMVAEGSSLASIPGFIKRDFDASFPVTDESYSSKSRNLVALVMGDHYYARWSPFSACEFLGGRVLLTLERANELNRPYGLRKDLRQGMTVEWEDKNWAILKKGDCPAMAFDITLLNEEPSKAPWGEFIAELYLKPSQPDVTSPLARSWSELFGDQCLSFKKDARQTTAPSAYNVLAEYITKWQQEKKPKRRRKNVGEESAIDED